MLTYLDVGDFVRPLADSFREFGNNIVLSVEEVWRMTAVELKLPAAHTLAPPLALCQESPVSNVEARVYFCQWVQS